MNHLAHCYLSFGDASVLLGNFIGDYVKGSDWERYPDGVRQGILLHRTIDAFTDGHALVKQCTARIRPFAGKFAGPVMDILFDHLLALQWSRYSHTPLADFCQTTYAQLTERAPEMPPILQERLPRMIAGDFLQGYLHREGLAFVFGKFAKRLPYPVDFDALLAFFYEEMPAFDHDFSFFFPELLEKAKRFSGIQ